MILDMRHDYSKSKAAQATIIVNASLYELLGDYQQYSNAKIISFDSFKDERVCSANRIKEFLEKRESICPNLELIDLSRACSPDADLESHEAKRFYRFVRTLKENTDIDIVATPELEKLFPILLPKDEEDENLLDAYVIPLKEEKYSSLQAVTKLQLAQAEKNFSPDLCREILEHNNTYVVTKRIISAIDAQLSDGTAQLEKYVPILSGCVAERYITPDNFDAVIDIAEKYIAQDGITIEDINFCFGLQKESSISEEAYQRINHLIKDLIPQLPEDVRQELDEKAALKEKKQQEYIQKRQKLQARVNEYSDYLLLSDAVYTDVPSEHILKVGGTILEYAGKYPEHYEKILEKINDEQDEYKIKAAAHWIEPIILRTNALGVSGPNVRLIKKLTGVVTQNQDVRHQFGHIFCQQLKENADSEIWLKRIKQLLDNNKDDHILLMNTYEDMEQAYKAHPELIPACLALFKDTLKYPDIDKRFNDHLHTLASIVGDTAREHPEYTDTAIEILSNLSHIENNLSDSSSKSYLRSKIDDAFDKIKQNDLSSSSRRALTIIYEKDQKVFAGVVKELMNDPQTDQQLIEKTIEMRLNSGLNVLLDDYNSAESLKWNSAVLQSKSLQNKGPEEISACAEHIYKGILKQMEDNPNYDPSKEFQAIYDAAPYWLKRLREKNSDDEDLLILQHFDRIPKKVQALYIGETPVKMDNLVATDTLKDFPEIVAQQLKLEVCDYISDITSKGTYDKEHSLSYMEEWAAALKENDGYSSPEVCVIALNEAMRIRENISRPNALYSCEYACKHFYKTDQDIKQLVKISNDIVDNVFEQIKISRSDNNPALTDAIKNALFSGLDDKRPLQYFMGEEAEKAFLAGDENYKKLWDKRMADRELNAYLMFDKPREILQDIPHYEKIRKLNNIGLNTYVAHHRASWDWKEFPELLETNELLDCVHDCSDKADESVAKAVKAFCQARIDDKTPKYSSELLTSLMMVYDAEAQKGIEDKEIFSILYKARFSKYSKEMQKRMDKICDVNGLTAPKLKSLCQTSHLVNRLWLKRNTIDK